jgi:hypothetical protein
MLLLVADSLKDGMSLRSLFADFETVRVGVQIHGCSIWVRPYDPVPLLVFNPHDQTVAVGDVVRAPDVNRLLDFVNFQSSLYPHHQRMVLSDVISQDPAAYFSFFYSQVEIPALVSGYVKIENGNFDKEIHETLWNEVIADKVWME